MSAFICSTEHISALAGYAHAKIRAYRDTETAELASILYGANCESLRARYNDENFGAFELDRDAASRAAFSSVPPVKIIKAAQCFDYQACEFEGWEKSAAKALIDRIIDQAITELPGWDDAPWDSPLEPPMLRKVGRK